jgi:Tfp pilus assembly protein FimV
MMNQRISSFFGWPVAVALWAGCGVPAVQAQSAAAHDALKALLGKAATQAQVSPGQPAAATAAAAAQPDLVPPAVAGSYQVRRGDTLDNIIRRLMPGVPRPSKALRMAFVQANPQAFPRQSPHYLKAGVVLRVPGVATDGGPSPAVATGNDAQARRHWVRFPR